MLTLQGLVQLLDVMEKEGIKLPLVEVSGSDKGVNLMTAHGSKGLEFEYILFAGCNASFWEKKRKPGGGYKLPDTMFSSQGIANDEEELRRLILCGDYKCRTIFIFPIVSLKMMVRK